MQLQLTVVYILAYCADPTIPDSGEAIPEVKGVTELDIETNTDHEDVASSENTAADHEDVGSSESLTVDRDDAKSSESIIVDHDDATNVDATTTVDHEDVTTADHEDLATTSVDHEDVKTSDATTSDHDEATSLEATPTSDHDDATSLEVTTVDAAGSETTTAEHDDSKGETTAPGAEIDETSVEIDPNEVQSYISDSIVEYDDDDDWLDDYERSNYGAFELEYYVGDDDNEEYSWMGAFEEQDESDAWGFTDSSETGTDDGVNKATHTTREIRPAQMPDKVVPAVVVPSKITAYRAPGVRWLVARRTLGGAVKFFLRLNVFVVLPIFFVLTCYKKPAAVVKPWTGRLFVMQVEVCLALIALASVSRGLALSSVLYCCHVILFSVLSMRILFVLVASRYQVAAIEYRKEEILWSFWFEIRARLTIAAFFIIGTICLQACVADVLITSLHLPPSVFGAIFSAKLLVLQIGLPPPPHTGIDSTVLFVAPFLFLINVIAPMFTLTRLPDFGAWFFLLEAVVSYYKEQRGSTGPQVVSQDYCAARGSLLELQFDGDFLKFLATEYRVATLLCYQDLIDFESTLSAPRAKSWFVQYVATGAPFGVPAVQKFEGQLEGVRAHGLRVPALETAKAALVEELTAAGSRYMSTRVSYEGDYGKLLESKFDAMASYPRWVSKMCSSCFPDPAGHKVQPCYDCEYD